MEQVAQGVLSLLSSLQPLHGINQGPSCTLGSFYGEFPATQTQLSRVFLEKHTLLPAQV